MFEKRQDYTDAIERLVGAFGETKPGTTVPFDVVEREMGVSRFERAGRHILRRFVREIERTRRIIVRQVPSTGLRFLTHAENARETPMFRQTKARRQVNRGMRETRAVDVSKLSDHERRVFASQRESMARHRLEIGRSCRAIEAATKPSATNFEARKATTDKAPPAWTRPR